MTNTMTLQNGIRMPRELRARRLRRRRRRRLLRALLDALATFGLGACFLLCAVLLMCAA